MISQKLHREAPCLFHHLLIRQLPLLCLFFVFLYYGFVQPAAVFADGPLVSQEIRYQMPEAGLVFLIWGINGWNVVSEAARPTGTLVKDGVMHTPMTREDHTFVARVRVPAGATLDYGFQTRKWHDGSAMEEWTWDGDYHLVAVEDDVIKVTARLTLSPKPAAATVPSARLPLLGLGLVFTIGAAILVRRRVNAGRFQAHFDRARLVYLRDLLRELVVRDMKLRYKRSVLGLAWSLINPLAQLLVLYLIFSLVLPLNIPNYPVFLFAGLLVWTWFQSSLFSATSVILENPDLIRRPGFPVAVLPVVTVITHLIHFLLALPILLIFLLFSQIQLTGALLLLPLVITLQFVFTLSLTYLVAAVHVTFRDTQYLLGILLLLGFYLSPIFYEASLIPVRFQFVYHLNPMVDLINAYRAILIQGKLPGYLPLFLLGGVSIVLLAAGYKVFVQTSYRFIEEL